MNQIVTNNENDRPAYCFVCSVRRKVRVQLAFGLTLKSRSCRKERLKKLIMQEIVKLREHLFHYMPCNGRTTAPRCINVCTLRSGAARRYRAALLHMRFLLTELIDTLCPILPQLWKYVCLLQRIWLDRVTSRIKVLQYPNIFSWNLLVHHSPISLLRLISDGEQ